jgi:hypothetical protein
MKIKSYALGQLFLIAHAIGGVLFGLLRLFGGLLIRLLVHLLALLLAVLFAEFHTGGAIAVLNLLGVAFVLIGLVVHLLHIFYFYGVLLSVVIVVNGSTVAYTGAKHCHDSDEAKNHLFHNRFLFYWDDVTMNRL